MEQLSFGYPRRGLEGHFCTFRLGQAAVKKFAPGDQVELVDARSRKVLKVATVSGVLVGVLSEMAIVHGRWAHNWKEFDQPADLLVASMKKRYPPNRVQEHSVCSVIYMHVAP
jgi:hypothetical protein